ncbi:MAG: tRNA (adenosine(37)-N6)-dimethylallyltransferase MiaA [Candidatus Pacebacteria bacterium]|nr:tRNA (adenosine(37)-N6)-dimethylallyltransferase MiaA [Candidatus Paceibacterota bacterium]
MSKSKVLVIVGPTASGKTSLSISLAKKFDGEITSADSRQVYKGLDIGTGKVTKGEMEGVPHHLLDVVCPKETYPAAASARDVRNAITDIHSRGRLPIIVGGTFFYVDALLGKIVTPEVPPNQKLRAELEDCSNEDLFLRLQEKDPKRSKNIDQHNGRRLIRALEIVDSLGSVPKIHVEELYDVLTLGIAINRDTLKENIHTRLADRLKTGMLEEVTELHKAGLSYERLSELGIEYQYLSKFIQGNISEDEMRQQIETKSWQYAKRQMMWLKRDKTIQWVKLDELEKIDTLVNKFLR